jgi:Zn-dependent peptidase ImmA (M78 family)
MIKNYLSEQELQRIDRALNDLLLNLHKSYPEDSLLDIVRGAIPGVQILERDFDPSIRGVIYKKSKEFPTPRILIRKSLSPEQKTYALAHELAHYYLDHPGKENFMLDKMTWDGSRRQQFEAQAQYFAASLLMPRDKFIWMAKAIPDDDALAKRFGVSTAAVRVRRNWLKI